MKQIWCNKSERTERLLNNLYKRGLSDRSNEWFRPDELEDISEKYGDSPVIIRKAYAIEEMLRKMTDNAISRHTGSYKIEDDELLAGVLPMGSNGLGKVFPNYLTKEEQRVAAFTNRSELSLLGHNTVNYENLLKNGITEIIDFAKQKLTPQNQLLGAEIEDNEEQNKRDFYEAVIISCQAVLDYSDRYAELAQKKADALEEGNPRKQELEEMARILKKVPRFGAESFHEALQSIYTFHVALHASMNYISLGRLDQVLISYLDPDKLEDENYIQECTQLFECFIIKAAGRLNLTTEYLLQQDHMDNNAALGVHPYYLDQRAGVNNFLQNIIIGGLTPDGKEASNQATYIILNAFENVNLSTPGIYVRLGHNSPKELTERVAHVISVTKNLPGILNDDVLIPALYHSLVENEDNLTAEEQLKYHQITNDYCVDGCWEPILNGISDWTFGMLNAMPIFQCTINRGASLDTNPGMLRGGKLSFITDEITSYEEFQENFAKYMQFFIDQSTFTLYQCYMMDEFIIPSPLYSSVLGTCLERGRDKSWGGVEYNIGGTILIGVPDVINNTAAIKKWVFDEGKYTLEEVREAMKSNFTAPSAADIQLQKRYTQMKIDFDTNTVKFGSKESNEIGTFIINTFCDAVRESKKLADRIFLKSPKELSEKEQIEILRLRRIAGYYGDSFQSRFGDDFNIRFTAGCGTFEQYPQQGFGIVASANRNSNDPMIANFSPSPGTIDAGAGCILNSLHDLPMERLSAGAITDLCIDGSMNDVDYIIGLLNQFIKSKGNMLTLTFGDADLYQKIYELSYEAQNCEHKTSAYKALEPYKHINVRVGGWQAPFVSMSLEQQKNYILRILKN